LNSQSDTVSLFDRLATEYDGWYQTPLGALADGLEQRAVFALAGEVKGRITLDASCGTGNYALTLARRGARVTAVDASASMLALAQEKTRREGLPIRLVQALLERLPFRSGSFELVTCILALEFVGDPGGVVTELTRLLAGAGYGALAEEQAIFFPPLNSARLPNSLRRFEGVGRRFIPGGATFLVVAGRRADA
jgi:ubiquinone/menaquinone biosynthesis C-methylase UbiE